MKSGWNTKKQLRALRERVLKHSDMLTQLSGEKIRNWIADPLAPKRNSDSGEYPGVAAVHLPSIAHFAAERGTERLLSGHAGGWSDIARSIPIMYWAQRMHLRLCRFRLQNNNDPEQLADRIKTSIVFGVSYAFHQDEAAKWLGEALLSDVDSEQLFRQRADWSPLNQLVYEIAARYLNRKVDVKKISVTRTCPAYEDIWTNWIDTQRVGAALDAAGEYHIANGNTVRERDEMDFIATYCNAVPWEILAVLRLRQEQGLGPPPLSHPFLQTPLMSPPESLPVEIDELLEQAVEAGRKIFPDL